MKYVFIAIVAVLFSGCGEVVETKECVSETHYFCFYNQTYKVEGCEDNITSKLVLNDDDTVKSCTTTIIYEEIETSTK